MKFISFSIALFLTGVASAHTQKPHLHILPDADSATYQEALKKSPKAKLFASGPIQEAISLGEKNLNWLKHMNSLRTPENQLRLTKPGQLNGIPIDSPKKYSPEIVGSDLAKLKVDMPKPLASVLFDGGALLDNPPTSEEDYVLWAKKLDTLYQTAVRWTLLSPYMDYLKQAKQEDVRGYYFLIREKDLEAKLRDFSGLASDEQVRLNELLLTLCQNTEGLSTRCGSALKVAVTGKKVFEFYKKYLPGGERLWKGFFDVQNPRREMVWNAQNQNLAVLPFRTPDSQEIADFLSVNIEDEWKWNGWELKIDFKPTADVRVRFVPGTTPNVNGLGGNLITMDANAPLTEWDVQWTIRHEFGHVLGFPDCYIEFYDTAEKAMINYQIDVDNMMCSRKGKIQQLHFDEMKAKYYRP